MAIGLTTLVKLARGGGLDRDTFEELCEQAGMKISFMELPEPEIPATFTEALSKGKELGAKAILLTGVTKTGEHLSGVFVLIPPK
jgi:hypothetical protein